MGSEVSHPLAESSGEETGEHKPAPGDLFAYYKMKLFLLPGLVGKEKQDRREDNHQVKLLHGRGHVFIFQLIIACLRSTAFKHHTSFCISSCRYGEASKSSYTHIPRRGGRAGKHLQGHVGCCWGEMWFDAPHASTSGSHGDHRIIES